MMVFIQKGLLKNEVWYLSLKKDLSSSFVSIIMSYNCEESTESTESIGCV